MKLRFLVDEDLPRSTARFLGHRGYVADDVRDLGLRGAAGRQVFERAQVLEAVLLTGDGDFANILEFPPGSHAGIIVSRIPDQYSSEALNRALLQAIEDLTAEEIRGSLIIVEAGRIRIRR
jgi:predicted nuclease of predicted toxin-antitoxin system